LVLLGAKARGLCYDVMLLRVFVGVFWNFCCGWVFTGFFFNFFLFLYLLCFCVLLYTSCMLRGAYAFYKIF
jgi:hypothetical protein